MDRRGYEIMILNLLNRAVDIEISNGNQADLNKVENTLEGLKGLVRSQFGLYKGE